MAVISGSNSGLALDGSGVQAAEAVGFGDAHDVQGCRGRTESEPVVGCERVDAVPAGYTKLDSFDRAWLGGSTSAYSDP